MQINLISFCLRCWTKCFTVWFSDWGWHVITHVEVVSDDTDDDDEENLWTLKKFSPFCIEMKWEWVKLLDKFVTGLFGKCNLKISFWKIRSRLGSSKFYFERFISGLNCYYPPALSLCYLDRILLCYLDRFGYFRFLWLKFKDFFTSSAVSEYWQLWENSVQKFNWKQPDTILTSLHPTLVKKLEKYGKKCQTSALVLPERNIYVEFGSLKTSMIKYPKI